MTRVHTTQQRPVKGESPVLHGVGLVSREIELHVIDEAQQRALHTHTASQAIDCCGQVFALLNAVPAATLWMLFRVWEKQQPRLGTHSQRRTAQLVLSMSHRGSQGLVT